MCCGILNDEAFVPLDAFQDARFFDHPGADVCPFLLGLRVFLLCMRRSPPRVPIIGKLFEEGSFDMRRLLNGLVIPM